MNRNTSFGNGRKPPGSRPRGPSPRSGAAPGSSGSSRQSSDSDVAGDERHRARLEYRHPTGAKPFEPGWVPVDAGDLMLEIGETRAREETGIASTDHADPHASDAGL